MQPITVMMVETDQDQSIAIEDLFKNNKKYIQIMNEIKDVGNDATEVSFQPRENFVDRALAKINRLNPKVILINANQTREEYFDLLIALQSQQPSVQCIFVINESTSEAYILRALANGAQGFVMNELASVDLMKIINAIDRGEIWASRKILSKAMDMIISSSQSNCAEVDLDSARQHQ